MLSRPRAEASAIHRQLTRIIGPWPPFDVEAVCNHFGLEVRYHAFPDDLSGFTIRHSGRLYAAINSLHSRGRQRFTVAHELGHFLMHQARLQSLYERKRMKWAYWPERQADAFAVELLMPRAWIMYYKRCFTRKQLAEECDVSQEAMRIRLEELGIRGSRRPATPKLRRKWRERAYRLFEKSSDKDGNLVRYMPFLFEHSTRARIRHGYPASLRKLEEKESEILRAGRPSTDRHTAPTL